MFQRVAMMLIMLPMWINFLLRTYAWMSILENTGLLNTLFDKIGLLATVIALFKKVEWKPIPHTDHKSIAQMESDMRH